MKDTNPTGKNLLTEEEAKLRASLVSNVKYNLSLSLTEGNPTYEVHLKVHFNFKGESESAKNGTFLDFIGKDIHKLEANGKEFTSEEGIFKENRLHFRRDMLKDGENTLNLHYVNDYNHNGTGFHQFIDPIDKKEYLFTDFEPFEAHRLLPVFDQPNIKGRYTVEITAPSQWEVLTNNPLTKSDAGNGRTTHRALETPPISSYIFAIVAGTYESFSDKVVVRGREVPLRILCRKSLVQYLQPDLEEIFTMTKQGFHFFTELFDFEYPFIKYDQIFVPEYNQGAMENAGCVTFNEAHVFRETPTDSKRLGRGDTVLHELSHMWFGNLVSPQWWDGLWLNESFASFMAVYCLAKATRFSGERPWQDFNSYMKRWAEREDQQSTTHPIQGSVPDTDATFLNFDGITYGKGAAVLKQLVAVIGEDAFKAGMSHYFKKHKWSNTTIVDFLKALEEGYTLVHKGTEKLDLIEWSKFWLETAGVNTLTPKIEYEHGKVSKFIVEQTAAPSTPTLRPHHIEIALFKKDDKGIPKLFKTLPVKIKGAHTEVPGLKGEEFDFVFLNYNDHAYAKTLLDEKSLKFVMENIEKFESLLLRQLLWGTLHHMLRDAKLSATNFLSLVRNKMEFIKEADLVQSILRSVQTALFTFTPDEKFYEAASKMFETSWKLLHAAKDSDSRITWANQLIGCAASKENVAKLLEWMDKGVGIKDFEFDQAMRWSIVVKANAWGSPDAEERLANEEKRDPSDRGQRKVEEARASKPDFAHKEKVWERIRTDKKSSHYTLTSVMNGFMWHHQRELLKPFEEKFFQDVRSVFKNESKEYSYAFGQQLFPFVPNNQLIHQKTAEIVNSLTSDEKPCAHCLKDKLDDLRRAKACIELDRKST